MNSSQERADTSQSQDTPQNKKKIQISQVHHNTLLQNNTDSLFGNNLSNNLAAKKGAGVASEAKKTKISSGVFNNGEDLALQLLIKGDKLSSDPLEEFKIEQSSNVGGASQFSRQLSESNSQRSLNSDDSQPDKLAATVKKQDIQILQNQLDVIEEEVEENGDNQKFSGFNAVKQKVDPRSGQQKDNKTYISGGGLNLNPALKQAQNDIMSLIKGGQSKGDRDSIMGNIGEGGPFISKAQDRRESVSIALNDKKSAINMKEQKLINDSPYQPPMENPYLKDKGLLFEEQLIDNQVQMEKVQLGLMGYHSLIYGNLVSIVIDQNEESFKLLSKKSISKKLSKKQFQEEELDSRCMFRIVPQSQYQAQLKMKMVVQSDVFPLNSIQREYDTLMAEAESNKVFQQQMMGTDVKYWVDIQIVHEHSKRFLCVDHMESSSINQYYDPKTFIDSDLKNITFTTQASKNTHFKLVPTCNFQSEGSGIISNGHYFYIIHTDKDNKDFYLYEHTKTQDFIFSESYKTPFRFSTIRDSISFEEEKCLRNSSNVIVTMANENYFLDLKTVPDLDQSLNKNLAQQIANNDKNQVHVGKVTYALDLERYDDIKSIDLSGFWVVEIQEEHDFRVKLKNMMTGQYLTAQHYDGMTSISMTKEDLPDQEFEIVPVNIRVDETKSIDKQLVFKIRTCPMNIGEYEEPKYLRASNHLNSSPHLQQTIQHIVFDETDHQRQHFILGKECELNKYDTFKFVFPDNDEFLEINICADSMQMLYSVIKSIQKQKGLPSFLQNQENFQLLATSNIMIGLLNYCNNKLEGKILPKQKMGEPVPYRQKLLERIGLLDYLFDYLDLIIDSKIRKPAITIASRKDQKQWETQIHQVFQLRNKGADTEYMGSLLEIIFELIYSIVQNQRSFKYDASQKIDILQKFIFVENAPKVLIEILREELGQLAKKEIHAISEPVKIYQFQKYIPLLDFFLQSLDPKNRKKRYIFLMRKICIQDGYPLPLVQEYIYNQLFKDTSNRGKILDIQVAGNGFNIYDEATQKSYEFFDFERPHFEQSPKYQQYLYRDPKFDKIKEFLLEEMDLLSDICQGRNPACCMHLRQKFEIDQLLIAIKNERIPKQFRAKFVRLLVVLYIDCEPHQEVQYSRILSYVEGSQRTFSLFDNQQRQIANMNQKFEEIYTFINDQLPQGSQIEEISQFEMQILYLCQNLLRFGLFTFEEGSSIKTVNIIKLSDYLFSMLQRISEKSSQQNILSDIEKFLILSLTQSGGTNENSLFTEKNLSVGNPVDRSSLDVKYLLFNKKQWNLMSDNVANNSKIMANLRTNLSNKIQQDKYYFNLQRIHVGIQKQIIEIFHLFLDVRQYYYLQNFLEFFRQEGILKLQDLMQSPDSALINIKNRIQAIVPKNYGQGKSYDSKLLKFQSISELFDGFKQRNRDIFKQVKTKTIISRKDREFVFQEAQLINFQQKYSSFTDIVIEVFNNCQEDEYLQQMSLSLISRFNSENGEFVRNVDKSLLLLDQQNIDLYQAISYQLNGLVQKLQRSNLWPMIDNAIPQKEYDELIAQLKKFKKLFYFEHRTLDRTKADFEIIDTNKKRRIFKLHQNIFRCLKGYDIILNYIQLNKNNFYNIQKRLQSITNNWGSGKGLSDIKINNIKMVQRIYKKCFSVLDAFTKNNKKCKNLMWKYKDFVIFPKLQGIPQIGELDFLRSILQDNHKIKYARNLDTLVQKLNQRIDIDQKNTAVILGIYGNLIAYHDLPYVKKAVFISIENNPTLRQLDKEQDPNIFETGITVLEILSYIVQGDTTGNTREILMKYFDLTTFIAYKNSTLAQMQKYVQNETYSEEKVEIFREKFLENIAIIYNQIYFMRKDYELYQYRQIQDFILSKLYEDMQKQCNRYKEYLLSQEFEEEKSNLSIAELKFILHHTQKYFLIPAKKIQRDYQIYNESDNKVLKGISTGLMSKLVSQIDQIGLIERNVQELKEIVMTKSNGTNELKNLLKYLDNHPIAFDIDQYPETDRGGPYESNEYFAGSNIFKRSQLFTTVGQKQTMNLDRFVKVNVKQMFLDKQTKNIKDLWKQTVEFLSKTDQFRKIIIWEQQEFGRFLYGSIMNSQFKQNGNFQDKELKFIYNCIQYIEKCDKMPWVVYNIQFLLKSLRHLQKFHYKQVLKHSGTHQYDLILSLFDSSYNFQMIITNFIANQDQQTKRFYHEIICQQIMDYCYSINPASQQQRFLAYFKNDKQSEYFFKYIYTSFQNSIEKINKKYVIEKFKGRQSLGSISNKIYYNTKYLDQDILKFLKMLSQNPSSEMKNILRKQPQNNRSYNIVLVVYKYFCSLLRHLDTPIVYNLVKSSLEFLNLMIQGLNFENQKILLDNGFFQIAKELLEIDYHYEMSDSQRIKLQKDNQAFEKYFKFRQYFQMDNRQISKLKLLVITIVRNLLSRHPVDSEIFLQLRREFQPDTFRKIMTECGYFFKNYHNNIYHHNVLFVAQHKQNYNNKYQYMIEIAFYSYFILKKIQHSIRYDKDDYFYKNLLYLMPEQQVYRQNKIVLIEKARQFFLGYFLFVWEMFDLLLQYFRKLINQKIPITEFQTDDQIRETFEFLDRHIGKVELVRSSGSLHTVQFIKLPYCQFKTDVEKDSFLNKVDRTNTQTKVEGLMKVHRNFIRQFKQDQNIQSIPILGQMSKYQETWAISSFVLSFIINIFILFSFYKDKKNSTTSGSSSVQVISTSKKLFGAADSDVSDSVINTCGILILCNCLFILILHGYGKIPIHFDVAFHPEKYKPRSKSGLIYHQHLQAGINQKKKRIARIKDGGKKMFKFLRLVTSDFPLMYHLMCVIFAFLGVTVHFFYFAFHLSYFIISSQTLFNVLRSIWEPKYKIFMTLILFLLIEYLFVIISFQTYRDYFPADNCENLLRCYLVTLDQTFKASGGVGGFLNSAYLSSESGSVDPNYIDYGRLLYDFFFNFILIILIIQMISGIIIDKFGALREQDDNIDRDSKTCCFICGQSKESIDKMYDGVGGFYSHISFDHNMWNYIYYCAYLYEKKKNTPKDLRDSEKEIIQKLENYDNSWLPAYYNYSEL